MKKKKRVELLTTTKKMSTVEYITKGQSSIAV